jgi:hypothetical protein
MAVTEARQTTDLKKGPEEEDGSPEVVEEDSMNDELDLMLGERKFAMTLNKPQSMTGNIQDLSLNAK